MWTFSSPCMTGLRWQGSTRWLRLRILKSHAIGGVGSKPSKPHGTLRWLMGLNCEYRVILRCLHMLVTALFFLISCECLGVQWDLWEILQNQVWKAFGPFLHIEFHHNIVASNMHFGYQMLTDLKLALLYLREGMVSQFFQYRLQRLWNPKVERCSF